MEYVALIGAGLQLCLLLFSEYFSARARAREENKQFVLDQAAMKLIIDAAVLKWNSKNAADSAQAGDAWDEADRKR